MFVTALNNREEFDLGVFGTDFVATAVGSFGGGLETGVAGTFSPEGGRSLLIPGEDPTLRDYSQAEDISDSGVVIGWRQENNLNLPPKSFLYSTNGGLQYLEDLFPQVSALSQERWPPDTGSVQGTKGLRINSAGQMIIQGAPTGSGGSQTSLYLVSPKGDVSPLFLRPGQGIDLNNLGQPPPPVANGINEVINDQGDYAGIRYTSPDASEFVATLNGTDLPDGAGARPTSINNSGWVAAYPGIIWSPDGNRTDLRQVLQNQLAGSSYPTGLSLTNGMSDTFVNDAGDVCWGELYLRQACPELSIDVSSDGIKLVNGMLTVAVGHRFTVYATISNTGRGPAHSLALEPSPATDLFQLVSGPTPPLPATLDPGQVMESTSVWEVVKPGQYFGNFAIHGEGACGPTQASAEPVPLQFVINPEVILTVDVPQPNYEIGDEFNATITVRSTKKDPQTISFQYPLLSAQGGGILDVPPVEPPDPFVLTTNDPPMTFTVPVVATNGGITELSTMVSVTDSSSDAMTNLTAQQQVIVSPLEVSLRAKPLIDGKPIVNMTLDDSTNSNGSTNAVRQVRDGDGHVISPAVEVTITNVADQPVEALLQGIDPLARDSSDVLGRIEVKGTFPQDMGTLPAHSQVSFEYPLVIHDDGRFDFSALVTGAFSNSPATTLVATREGAPIAVGETYPMEIDLELSDPLHEIQDWGHGTIAVAPGASVRVLGTVQNRTSNGTLEFTGIKATFGHNAFGGILTTTEGSLDSPPMAPLSVSNAVDADSAVILAGTILTATNGPPTGTVTWILPDDAKLIDDLTGKKTDLTSKDILLKTTFGGWGGDDLTARIVQDNSRPVLAPQTYWQEATHYTHGAMVGIGEFAYTSFDSIGALGRLAGKEAADPAYLANVLGDVTRSVWNAAELMANTWQHMSDADRQAFINRVAAEVQRRALLEATTGFPFDANDIAQVVQFTQKAVYPMFNGIEQAYASGDPAQIEELQGTIGANLALQVATSFVPTPEFTRYAKTAELAELAENADNIRNAANTQQTMLRDMADGPVNRDIAENAWGVGDDELTLTQKILKVLGMKGYLRERSARALELISQLGEAVWKPELMKPKSINDLDLLILGDNVPQLAGKVPGTTLDLEGAVAIFRPEDDAAIRTRLEAAGESEDVIRAVLGRAEARREEYEKYLPEFEQWSKEGLPVSLNYKDNEAVPPRFAQPGGTRKFEFESISEADGPVIHVPKMANADGEMRYIAGDVDWVHFCWMDGTPLSPEAAGMLYDLLSRYCGLQHPEVVSWIKEGQTIFKAKANQLVDYIVGDGKKALLEVTGDSLRAVRIDTKLTRFAADGRNHLIFFDEGTKSLQAALSQAKLETAFADASRWLQLVKPKPILLPFLWIESANSTNSSIGGNNQWSYSDSPDAILARRNDSGEIQRFDGQNWVSWTPPAQGSSIQLTPTTALDSDVSAGTTEIPITPLDQLWANELTGHLDAWFKAGDTVVIAPGQPSQEVRKVASLGSLVLDQPLQYNHPAGTLVAVVPANLSISEIPGNPSVRILSLAVDQGSGTATITWSSTAQQSYTIEESADLSLGSWSPVGGTVVADGSTTSVSLPIGSKGSSQFYRVLLEGP